MPKVWMHKVADVKSMPEAALATQHFPILVVMAISLEKERTQRPPKQKSPNALKNFGLRNRFAALAEESLKNHPQKHSEDVNTRQPVLKEMFEEASTVLPETQAIPHKLWITTETLNLIERRATFRRNKDETLDPTTVSES